ncbi:MAG TPA: hypothetical protein VJ901_00235 [Thermoanaerobaculia bacterium]|nr:hypothetical protein [Thermoanaerobaculia bacterium]
MAATKAPPAAASRRVDPRSAPRAARSRRPGVWHGLHNIASADALMVNFPSRPYDYDDPDHYRLPYDAEEIPYVWKAAVGERFRADAR